jgi:hypothetical protein
MTSSLEIFFPNQSIEEVNINIPNFCLHLPYGPTGSAGAIGVLSTALL